MPPVHAQADATKQGAGSNSAGSQGWQGQDAVGQGNESYSDDDSDDYNDNLLRQARQSEPRADESHAHADWRRASIGQDSM